VEIVTDPIAFLDLSLSFLGRDTPFLNEIFRGFIQAFQENKGILPRIRQRPLLSAYCPTQ